VSPGALGAASPDPSRTRDHLSADFLVALAARAVREVGILLRRARATGLRLPALSLDTEIRFRSPAERSDFAAELADAVTALVARYHAPEAADGRDFRLTVLAHPIPAPEEPDLSPSVTASPTASASPSKESS
jgi:hypothetical protein